GFSGVGVITAVLTSHGPEQPVPGSRSKVVTRLLQGLPCLLVATRAVQSSTVSPQDCSIIPAVGLRLRVQGSPTQRHELLRVTARLRVGRAGIKTAACNSGIAGKVLKHLGAGVMVGRVIPCPERGNGMTIPQLYVRRIQMLRPGIIGPGFVPM